MVIQIEYMDDESLKDIEKQLGYIYSEKLARKKYGKEGTCIKTDYIRYDWFTTEYGIPKSVNPKTRKIFTEFKKAISLNERIQQDRNLLILYAEIFKYKGKPDFLIIPKKRKPFFVEIKNRTGKLTKQQKVQCSRIVNLGIRVYVRHYQQELELENEHLVQTILFNDYEDYKKRKKTDLENIEKYL